jgi:hypothetical protein
MNKDELALWCKKKEIEALKEKSKTKERVEVWYWDGKSIAFSQVWEYIIFEGKEVTTEEFNRANEEWSKKAQEI